MTAPVYDPALPLVVFADVAVCDTTAEHAVSLVSDGARAFAHLLDWPDQTEVTAVCRTGTQLEAACPADGCTGYVRFHLDTEGTWTADPHLRALLAANGKPVER